MCAHCSGARGPEAEPFRGRGRVESEPYLFKGRDVCEWRGMGRSIPGTVNTMMGANGQAMHNLTQDTLTKGSCVRPAGFSSWGQEQALRTMGRR